MRLQPLQAIVASHVLKTVNETVDMRNGNAQILDEGLKSLHPFVKVPPRPDGYLETYSLYMAKFERRDELINYLNENGIESKIHYPVPLHLQDAAVDLGYKEGDFPISETYCKEIMTLPAHQFITSEQFEFTLESIQNFYLNKQYF